MEGKRPLRFEKHGRTYQLRIRTAEDLAQVLELDDALWVATSAPVSCLNGDAEFLDFVDSDGNGRIRSPEVRAAVRWLFKRLKDRRRLPESTDNIALEAIDDSCAEGRRLRQTARFVLRALGEDGSECINLAHIQDYDGRLESNAINGDGVITPDAAEDEPTAQFVTDVMSCLGAETDRTGRSGISAETLDRFIELAQAHLDWASHGDIPPGERRTEVMPLGAETPDAYAAFEAIARKVDGFFARCRVARFQSAPSRRVGIAAHQLQPDDLLSPEAIGEALARAPLSEPDPAGVLPLDDSANPVFVSAVLALRDRVVRPLLGAEAARLCAEGDWEQVKSAMAPYARWQAAKPGEEVEGLGRATLTEYASAPCAESVRRLLAADKEVAVRQAEVRELRRLLLCHMHLLRLANNFVSFPDLYDPDRRAMFEMGSLVVDGRWFNFAVKVDDISEHSNVARTSGMFIMYAELTRVDEAQRTVVAVPATAGTMGNLCVGKRGVFYDTRGRHYDARVVRIIENPISFREAVFSPFVRLGRFVAGKIEAISGSAQSRLETQLGQVTGRVQTGFQEAVRQAPAAVEQAPPPEPKAVAQSASATRRDVIVGASLSIAALSSALAFITKQLSELKTETIVVAAVIGALAVLVPTTIRAGVKLARRDLSAILEGCGWAINARMRLNSRQRRMFTRQEAFPAGSTGTPRSEWLLPLLLALMAALIALGVMEILAP